MKVNVLSLLSLSLMSTFSASSYAVEGGTSLTWSEHPYLIETIGCTGTVLAGKFVLIAGHCINDYAILADGSRRNMIDRVKVDGVDIAVWTLDTKIPMDKAIFIANLNDDASIVNLDDKVSFMGFGQNDYTPRLGQAFNHVTDAVFGDMGISYSDTINAIAYSVPGDSGAPVLNADNRVVAVNYSADGNPDGQQSGVNLRFVRDWLLQSVNSWHSVTELKFTGTKRIEVQSLHVLDTDLSERQNNGTLTTGDVEVTGGSCVTDGAVPFGICILELSSNGGEGKVILEDGNEITINRVVTTPPTIQPDSGSSGGSMGAFSILALLAVSLRRVFSKTAR